MKHLIRDLDKLSQDILTMGADVEHATDEAILATSGLDVERAQRVIDGDKIIDEKEVAIEEDCLKVLALHQPVAKDLRFLITVLKVNNDLERVGDLAVNIAKRAKNRARQSARDFPESFGEMVERVRAMLRKSLSALVNLDTGLAWEVRRSDDAVDDLHRDMFHAMTVLMHKDSSTVDYAVTVISTCRSLERIADLATNIAEDVIFLVDGEVVRHQGGDV